ncbi:MAG: ABC transporter ATP-binding protein [Deltaproteobacteria bacterium]|nr:ABC transporter ATP-binding protein [Deltaproteobacteria bacterium]
MSEDRVRKNTILEARGVQKAFRKGKLEIPVLKKIDLSVARGESVAIVGASGAGKSTLLHILGTLDEPTGGKVVFHGGDGAREVFSISEEERAVFRNRHMGFVFQFHHLLPEFTALENVLMPGLIAGRQERDMLPEAERLLGEVGLSHRLNHKPSELSGGECQRAAVARALFMRPDILFGDELTGNLDSANSDSLISLLLELNRRHGVSLVVVTHDHDIAKKMSRTVEIRDGQIIHH